eukprot:5927560-Prymnesium_polylepis.2
MDYSGEARHVQPTLFSGARDTARLIPRRTRRLLARAADYYSREAVGIVEAHARQHGNNSTPLFMYLAIQNVHSPYTLPPSWQVRQYPKMGEALHTYANMLATLDGAVGNVTSALRNVG